jgi:hypothetical protein
MSEAGGAKKTVDEDFEVQKARVYALAKDVEILNAKVQTWVNCYGALIAAEKDLSMSFAGYFEQPPTDAWREGTMTYDEHVTQVEENEFKAKLVRAGWKLIAALFYVQDHFSLTLRVAACAHQRGHY